MTAAIATPDDGPDALPKQHPNLVRLGQIGWLVKGVVYVLAGFLAVIIAARSYGSPLAQGPSEEASPTGAIKQIAGMSGGRILLVVLGIGLVLYALWRLATAALPGGKIDAESLALRGGYFVSAILYATFAVTAFSLAKRPQQRTDGDEKVTDISAHLLSSTVGRYSLGLAGFIAIGAGIYRTAAGLRGDVTKEIALAGMSRTRVTITKRLGMAGEIGRGLAVGLIGFFLVRSAVRVRASEATGLDGALNRLSSVAWGRILVLVIAVGFLLYGLLCIETFTRRKLRVP